MVNNLRPQFSGKQPIRTQSIGKNKAIKSSNAFIVGYNCFAPFLTRVRISSKLTHISIFFSITERKLYDIKVLHNSFHLNGHTIRCLLWARKLLGLCCSCVLSGREKGETLPSVPFPNLKYKEIRRLVRRNYTKTLDEGWHVTGLAAHPGIPVFSVGYSVYRLGLERARHLSISWTYGD